MIPTPDLTHLTPDDYEHIYEPAEDTFILLDALEADADELKALEPRICLEIGSGSGCVSCFMGKLLVGQTVLYLCTDISPRACICSYSTGVQNKVLLDPINTTLARPLSQRLRDSVDVVLFNPPYVPTVSEEAFSAQTTRDIQGSWAGGHDGMQITDVFLQSVPILLSPRGRFYLVAVKDNDIFNIQQRMLNEHGLSSDVVLQRRAGREHLFVIKFWREGTASPKNE